MAWYDFIVTEGAKELEARRELQRIEAEGRAQPPAPSMMENAALSAGVPKWAIPAALGVAVLLVAFVALK